MKGHLRIPVLVLILAVIAGSGPLLANEGQVDELRIGTEIDASGEVNKESHAEEIPDGVPIYASMRVEEAQKGTELMLTVLDRESEETVFSESQAVNGGHQKLNFKIADDEIEPGKYRVKVKLGEDWVAEEEFQITAP